MLPTRLSRAQRMFVAAETLAREVQLATYFLVPANLKNIDDVLLAGGQHNRE